MTTASNSDARKRLAARNTAPDTTELREATICGERGDLCPHGCNAATRCPGPYTDATEPITSPEPDATVSDPAALTDAEGVAFDWHDATCPEGAGCRDRFLHATCGGGAVLPIVERIVAARVAEAVEQERAAAWDEAAELADTVIVSWSAVSGLHPTEPEPHPAALRAAGARRTLVVLRSRVAEAFDDRRALLDDTKATS